MICLLVKWIMDLTNNLGTYKIGVYDVISEPTKAFKINKHSEHPTETLQNTKWTHSAISSNMVNPARSWFFILTNYGGSVCDQDGLSNHFCMVHIEHWIMSYDLGYLEKISTQAKQLWAFGFCVIIMTNGNIY